MINAIDRYGGKIMSLSFLKDGYLKNRSKNFALILLILFSLFLSGCSLLQLPGAILGGASKLLGVAVEIGKKVPWWMWL